MPQSKWARRRPKYTPPAVCHKAIRGGAFDVPETTCPTANFLTACIRWPSTLVARTGAGTSILWLKKQTFPGCHYFGQASTPANEQYFIAIDLGGTGRTCSIHAALGLGHPNRLDWVNGNATCDAASPNVLPATIVATTQPAPPPDALTISAVI